MNWRKLLNLLFAALFVLSLLPAAAMAQGNTTGAQEEAAAAQPMATIEQDLLNALTEGPTDFFIEMEAQADLSKAFEIEDWSERGRYVYDTLRAVADKSQAPVIEFAKEQGLTYRSFFSGNTVYIEGGELEHVNVLASLPGVARLRLPKVMHIDPQDAGGAQVEGNTDAYGWNLDTLDPSSSQYGMQAAQVWSDYGVTGSGIVVANIDTGAYYEHEALVEQYRGNLGGGNFDHDFNWYMPTSGCGDGTYPCDNNSHGSGTIGIMAGERPDLVYQIGVAPGTTWIACKGCETNGCSEAALTGCADWMVAPCPIGVDPGDPLCDPDMRPHVINNSWGGGSCDEWYRSYVQAWVAAGQFPAFSAGNSTACSAVGSPGDNIESFGTAGHNSSGGNLYAGGPSCFFPTPSCDPDAHEIDPHLNAPTFGLTASNSQGTYFNLSGTSGASPHTAGTVALIWSANPGLIGNIDETFKILEQSAHPDVPAGSCGEPACAVNNVPNYEYGWGYLDAHAAVTMAGVGQAAWLNGTVTEQGTGNPLPDITITAENAGGGGVTTTTGPTGYYSTTLAADTYTVTAEGPMHTASTVANVVVTTGTVTTQNFVLDPKGLLYGYVTDADSGAPLEATVNISPTGDVVPTDPADGYYEIYLDAGAYDVTAEATDYASQTVQVSLTSGGSLQQDFALLAAIAITPDPIAITLELGTAGDVTAWMTNNMAVAYPFVFLEVGAAQTLAANDILLLGDDVDATGWQTYRDALTAVGLAWDEWDLDSLSFPTAAELAPYTTIIVFDESTMLYGNAECQILADWLVSGDKSMFATSIDWLWDLENGTVGSGEHNLYLLFASEYVGDGAGTSIITLDGIAGDPVGGDFAPPNEISLAGSADSNGDYVDIALSAATTGLIYGAGGTGSGYSALTHYEGPGYATVWLGVNFHNGLTDQAERNALMANIMAFLIGSGDIPWYEPSVVSGTLPAGATMSWTNYFTATPAAGVAQPGLYEGTLRVKPESSGLPGKDVALELTVTAPSTWGLLEGTVTSERTGEPLETDVLVENSVGTTWTLPTDPATGYYSYWLDSDTYSVTADALGYIPETAVVGVTGGATTTQDFALELDAAWIDFQNDSYEQTLEFGMTATDYFTITNLGPQSLIWELGEVDNGMTPLSCILGACEEYYGGNLGSAFSGGVRDRGDFFEATEATVISEMFAYLDFSGATDMYFAVYEADALVGTYTKIFEVQVPTVGPGLAWWSSGPVNVPVQAGKFYYIAPSWNGSATYYRNSTVDTPFTTNCFGILHTGAAANRAGYPPAESFNNTYGSGQYASYGVGLITGGGDVPWLAEMPISGTIPAYSTFTGGEISFDAGAVPEPGHYYADLRVTSNDPLEPQFTVPVTLTVLPSANIGKLEGIVTADRGPVNPGGGPLEAEILIESSGGMTWTTTSDPDTGYYYQWLNAGFYDVTASAPDYLSQTVNIEIQGQMTTTQNFELLLDAPDIAVTPPSMEEELVFGNTAVQTLTITNDGVADLDFEIMEVDGGMMPLAVQPAPTGGMTGDVVDEYPVITSEAECAAYENYTGREPIGWAEFCAAEITPPVISGEAPDFPTDIAYAQDIGYISDNFVWFYLNDFPGQTVIGTNTAAYYGVDFDLSATTLYALNDTTDELGVIDLSTGAFTGLVPCPPGGGAANWTGLSIDPTDGTFWASTGTDLFTIDPATGASTSVGSFGTSLMIEIAVGPDGEMYGHDIGTDSIYHIDKTTGQADLIGPTGYAANYAQGMDFDNSDGTLYIFLYVGSGVHAYGTVDLTTGAVTPLATTPQGEFEGAVQVAGGGDVPWLAEQPITGTVPAGTSLDVAVTFDSGAVPEPATYMATLKVNSNDPFQASVMVPVTMTVLPSGDIGKLEGIVTGSGYCGGDSYPLEADILIENSAGLTWTTTADPTGYYYRWLEADTYTVTLSADEHVDAVETVEVMAGMTTTLDVVMSYIESCMDVVPTSFSLTLPVDVVYTDTLSIINDGAGELMWEIKETTATLPIHIPAFTAELPQSDVPVSFGPAPQMPGIETGEPSGIVINANPAFTINLFDDTLYNIPDLDTPGTWNAVGGNIVDAYAGDFVSGDFDTLYAIDNSTQTLYAVDTATGASTAIGTCNTGKTWTGLSFDPTTGEMYGVATDGATATLYTIDLDTAALTTIGTVTGYAYTIDIAFDTEGNLYGVDISTDEFISIDKSSGAAYAIGSLGFAANYAQGLDYDEDAGIMYWAAYGASGELRIIDIGSGASAYVGAFSGGAEVDSFAIPVGGMADPWIDVPWVSEVPTNGLTLPYDVFDVDVVFDTNGLTVDECYIAALGLFHDDPGWESPFMIPLTLCVSSNWPVFALTKTAEPMEQVPGGPVTYTIVFGNDGDAVGFVTVSDMLPADVAYVSSDPPGMYDPVGHSVVWSDLTLGAGQYITATILVNIEEAAVPPLTLTNMVTLDWFGEHLEAEATHYVVEPVPVPVFSLTKSAAPAEQVPGGMVTYTVTFGNDGDAVTDVTVTDMLPAGVNYVDSDPMGTYDSVSHSVVWSGLALDTGQYIVATIWVTIEQSVVPPATLTNVVTLEWTDQYLEAEASHDVVEAPVEKYYLYLPIIVR